MQSSGLVPGELCHSIRMFRQLLALENTLCYSMGEYLITHLALEEYQDLAPTV